jgi:glucosamine-6-phosphate isomerase
MRTEIYSNFNSLSEAVANKIIETVKNKPTAVLCFATGNTPVLTYRLLAQKTNNGSADFTQCTFIELDEWIGLSPETPGSCNHSLNKLLFNPMNIANEKMKLFDALAVDEEAECRKMSKTIEELGGIDLMLVGVGKNGHIGFNEPGTSFDISVHVSQLHAGTIEGGKKYFAGSTPPGKGFTLGLKNVLDARLLIAMANGTEKASVIQQAIEGSVTEDVPVSVVQKHVNGFMMLDEEAASLLKK